MTAAPAAATYGQKITVNTTGAVVSASPGQRRVGHPPDRHERPLGRPVDHRERAPSPRRCRPTSRCCPRAVPAHRPGQPGRPVPRPLGDRPMTGTSVHRTRLLAVTGGALTAAVVGVQALSAPHGPAAGDPLCTGRRARPCRRSPAASTRARIGRPARSGWDPPGGDPDQLLGTGDRSGACTIGYGPGRKCLRTSPPSAGQMGMPVQQMPGPAHRCAHCSRPGDR